MTNTPVDPITMWSMFSFRPGILAVVEDDEARRQGSQRLCRGLFSERRLGAKRGRVAAARGAREDGQAQTAASTNVGPIVGGIGLRQGLRSDSRQTQDRDTDPEGGEAAGVDGRVRSRYRPLVGGRTLLWLSLRRSLARRAGSAGGIGSREKHRASPLTGRGNVEQPQNACPAVGPVRADALDHRVAASGAARRRR